MPDYSTLHTTLAFIVPAGDGDPATQPAPPIALTSQAQLEGVVDIIEMKGIFFDGPKGEDVRYDEGVFREV